MSTSTTHTEHETSTARKRFVVGTRRYARGDDEEDYYVRDKLYAVDHGPYERSTAHALAHVWNVEEEEYTR